MATIDPSASRPIVIFDTTLRDGEQSPGASMNLAEKMELARALVELGVDVIEAGFPIASPGDFESVHEIASLIKGPVICGLSRSAPGDILRAAEAIQPAERRRIHTFISTSPLHMKYKLRMEPDAVLEAVRAGEVDAFVVGGPSGEQVFTLHGADEPYRIAVEQTEAAQRRLAAEAAQAAFFHPKEFCHD